MKQLKLKSKTLVKPQIIPQKIPEIEISINKKVFDIPVI